MSLCTYCRIHNEESLIDMGEENYCQSTGIWSEDELEEAGRWVPKDLQGYEICESCYEEKKNNFNKLTRRLEELPNKLKQKLIRSE